MACAAPPASSRRREHGAGISVETRADILYVEHHSVEILHLGSRQTALIRLIQADDRDAGGLIFGVGDGLGILGTGDTVLGRIDCG